MLIPTTLAELEKELALGDASRYDPHWIKAELRRLKAATRMITCQYTGVQFEATSPRQKNHPLVSSLLNDASKTGTAAYHAAKAALESARAAGETDINAIVQQARTAAFGAQTAADQERAVRLQAHKAAADRAADVRAERAYTNNILRAGGYRWHKEDEESMDFAGPNAFEAFGGRTWTLVDSNGRDVGVHQAMTELANTGNVRAAEWLRARQES